MNEALHKYEKTPDADAVRPDQNTERLSPETRGAAIEALVTNPEIFCTVDYWTKAAGGSGIKRTKGERPGTSTLTPQILSRITEYLQKKAGLGPFDLGKGAVGKMDGQDLVLYVLLARGKHAEDRDRPDIVLCTEVPRTSDFSPTMDAIDTDPTILVDGLRRLVPDPVEPGSTQGIGEDILVSSGLLDVPQAVKAPYYHYRP